MKKNEKIFIAGASGLLGSAMVRKLQREGFSNLLISKSSNLDLRNQKKTLDFFQAEKPDYVFLCAAKVGGIQANIDSPAEFLYDNLQIQNNVIESSRLTKVKKLLFVGSSCIYPKQASCPIPESALLTGSLEPTNEGYALAKIAGVRMCQYYRKQYECNFIVAIPSNLYGIQDHYDPRKSHLLPALILKIHQAKIEGRKSIELWGSGKAKREFMLSDDCADALFFLMENYSGEDILNIGTGVNKSVLELAKITAKVLKVDVEFKFDPSKPDGMMRKDVRISKLTALGWHSKFSLEEGIQIAYQDFLEREKKGNL